MYRRILALTLVLGLAAAWPAGATEGGGGAYPNGAEGFMTGAVPPPGHYLINYTLLYQADEFMGPSGNDIQNGRFDLTVFGNVLRYIHVSKKTVLGASWAQHIFVPVLYLDVESIVGAGPDGSPITASDDKTGLGDLIVDPCILAWHFPTFHCAAGIDIYVPVGAYDEDDLANIGRDHWTFEPVFAATYLNQGYEVSAKFMYDINLKNRDNDVEDGDEFHVDFAAGKEVGAWKLGLGGYYYAQTTDDDYPDGWMGPDLSDGKVWALGPQVAYQHKKLTFIAKYQKEMDAENKPEGDKWWFKVVCPF